MTTNPTRPHRIVLWLGVTFFGLVIFAWSWWRWWTFRYTTFDLAFYVQALSEALHGRWQVSLLDVPLLGNHAEPIVFLLLPIFALWPHAMLPVAAQTLALATMPFTARRIVLLLGLGEKEALLLALATILAPATGWMGLHEFHPETLSAPLILLLAEARLRGRLGCFWCWWLLLLGCKENLALMLMWWGLVFSWIERREGWRHQMRWHLGPAAVAVGWLVFYAAWLAPWLNGGRVDYLELYSHLGRTKGEVISALFTKPERILSSLWTSLRGGNLLPGVVLSWCALSILRPRWLLIAAPILLQHLLSWRSSEWSIRFHYGAPLLGLMWIAMAEAVARRERKLGWCWAVVGCSAIGQALLGPVRELPGELATIPGRWAERRWKAELLAPILARGESSATVSNGFLPHVAARKEVHSLHHVLKGLKTLSRTAYTPPPPPDLVLIDFGDDSTFSVVSGFYHPRMQTADGRIVPSSDALLDAFLRPGNYQSFGSNAVRLFLRGPGDGSDGGPAVPELRLTNARVETDADGSSGVRVEWDVPLERTKYPWLALAIMSPAGLELMPLGMAAPGADAGASVQEWKLRWPPTFKPGRYRLRLWLYDHQRAAGGGGILGAQGDGAIARFDLGEADVGSKKK
jgi:uncharacterized membrane protein